MATDRVPVLEEFYKRIAAVVEAKGGTPNPIMLTRTMHVQTATPKVEGVPALLAQMPGAFEVEFAPEYALSTPGNVLIVRATRKHQGMVKDSQFSFHFGPDGQWRYGNNPLRDEDIEACLTLTGPPIRRL
jgi:hypothetical protein